MIKYPIQTAVSGTKFTVTSISCQTTGTCVGFFLFFLASVVQFLCSYDFVILVFDVIIILVFDVMVIFIFDVFFGI